MLERKKLNSRNHGVPESLSHGVTESRSFLVRYRKLTCLEIQIKLGLFKSNLEIC